MTTTRIKELPQHIGEKVTIDGWLYNKRTSGKLQFPIVRDGSGRRSQGRNDADALSDDRRQRMTPTD